MCLLPLEVSCRVLLVCAMHREFKKASLLNREGMIDAYAHYFALGLH